MSDREWRFYLDDMLGFAENVMACSAGRMGKGALSRAHHNKE